MLRATAKNRKWYDVRVKKELPGVKSSVTRIVETPIGRLAVSADEYGLLRVTLAMDRQRSAGSTSRESERHITLIEKHLALYFAGKLKDFDMSFSLSGTPFQIKVWKALARIPFGKVITYRELAEKIGYPNAQQAVGQAVKANPLGICIPCHRVVPSTFIKEQVAVTCGGYAWGSWRKALLLKREFDVLDGRFDSSYPVPRATDGSHIAQFAKL
jgi:methylated-DNA-[protein]-cysteine S-methyltransferase